MYVIKAAASNDFIGNSFSNVDNSPTCKDIILHVILSAVRSKE